MKKQFHLTAGGLADLQAELAVLMAGRSAIAEDIRVAREQGDLTENAEYQAAKQAQERSEDRIVELDHILKNMSVIKKPKADGKVSPGSVVKLKSQVTGKEKEFIIVGTVEADPLKGKISDESPIGKALLGKKQGEVVEIVTPADTNMYTITSVA